jgi:hypothetical protein
MYTRSLRLLCCTALALAVPGLVGCAGAAFLSRPVAGGPQLYVDTRANEQITAEPLGALTGEACAASILGLVTTGNASVLEAAGRGGIRRVTSVDNHYVNYLNLYARYCIVVTGE